MSVVLSHIELVPPVDDEAELDREDQIQQEELEAFLEVELSDEDLFDDSFGSTAQGRILDLPSKSIKYDQQQNQHHKQQQQSQQQQQRQQEEQHQRRQLEEQQRRRQQEEEHQQRQQSEQQQRQQEEQHQRYEQLQQSQHFHANQNSPFYQENLSSNTDFHSLYNNNEVFHNPDAVDNMNSGGNQAQWTTQAHHQEYNHIHDADIANGDSSYGNHHAREHFEFNDGYGTRTYDDQNYFGGAHAGSDPTQLKVLYAARGRKIESLQRELEEKDEEMSKENRILQHKLTLCTGDRDGLKTSVEQLQALLSDQKKEYLKLENLFHEEQESNRNLGNRIHEYEEKLLASDETVESLQQQVQQMMQSDSLARARAQHESLLATMRQKHEEEILSLKEKLDDMKQSLAWKTEDVNRYRGMMDSNSTASEIGMLRHRLATEEANTKSVRSELDKKSQEILDLEEQLSIYETLMKNNNSSNQQFSSTPFHAGNLSNMRKGALNFKTPVSKFRQSLSESPPTPSNDDGNPTLRSELVNALSSNHKKRKEITALRDELNKLNAQLLEQKAFQPPQQQIIEDVGSHKTTHCENCQDYLNRLNQQHEQSSSTIEKLTLKLEAVVMEKMELQTNMAELVKTFDMRKSKDIEAQNSAMHQLVDDAKEAVRNELEAVFETEKAELNEELKKLGGELLYTKDEYIRLSEEMKSMGVNIKKDFQNESQLELEELKLKLETEFKEKLNSQEIRLTYKYLDDIESERKKWESDAELQLKSKMEQAVTLAQCRWEEQYSAQKKEEISVAVKIARAEWAATNDSKDFHVQESIEKLKVEWSEQQRITYEKKMEIFQKDLEAKTSKEFDEKLNHVIEEAKKVEKERVEEAKKAEKERIEKDCKTLIQDNEDALKADIVKLQLTITSQKQQLNRAEFDLKLKENLFSRQESDWKHSIEMLRNELTELQTKSGNENDVNRSQTSVIFDQIVDLTHPKDNNEQKELDWKTRENELVNLLKEAREKLLETLPQGGEGDDSVFNGTLLEKLNNASWTAQSSLQCKANKKLYNSCERSERSTATSRVEEEIAGCKRQIASQQQEITDLTKQLVELKKVGEDVKRKHSLDVQNVEKAFMEYKSEAERHSKDVEHEKELLLEKHKTEIKKLLDQEQRRREELERRYEEQNLRMKNNILADVTNQQQQQQIDLSCEKSLENLKEKHIKEMHKLKQNFRAKLEKISDMKKKWMEEEEAKRIKLQETVQKEAELMITNLRLRHDDRLSKDKEHWQNTCRSMEEQHHNDMYRCNEEHKKLVASLKEEFNVFKITVRNENDLLKKEKWSKEQELRLIQEKHEQLLSRLKSLEEASIFKETLQHHHQQHQEPTLVDQAKSGNNVQEEKNELTSIESMRKFYLESLKNIQHHLKLHITQMREKARLEVKEAIRRERKELINNLKKKKQSQNSNIDDVSVSSSSSSDTLPFQHGRTFAPITPRVLVGQNTTSMQDHRTAYRDDKNTASKMNARTAYR